MADARAQEVDRLLQEGLDHYGAGETEQALACWRRVLEIEPDQPEAREYLQAAEEPEEAAPAAGDGNDVIREAQRLLGADPEAALELLETAAAREPERVDIQTYIDMVRSRLLRDYRARLGQHPGVPHPRLSPDRVLRYNLPADAGFVLSLVDGATPVKDLLSLCGMDEFRALRILSRLIEAGIVEMRS